MILVAKREKEIIVGDFRSDLDGADYTLFRLDGDCCDWKLGDRLHARWLNSDSIEIIHKKTSTAVEALVMGKVFKLAFIIEKVEGVFEMRLPGNVFKELTKWGLDTSPWEVKDFTGHRD